MHFFPQLWMWYRTSLLLLGCVIISSLTYYLYFNLDLLSKLNRSCPENCIPLKDFVLFGLKTFCTQFWGICISHVHTKFSIPWNLYKYYDCELVKYRNLMMFYGEVFLSPFPTPICPQLLFNMFRLTLLIWKKRELENRLTLGNSCYNSG
jgi:hypothetical protein